MIIEWRKDDGPQPINVEIQFIKTVIRSLTFVGKALLVPRIKLNIIKKMNIIFKINKHVINT